MKRREQRKGFTLFETLTAVALTVVFLGLGTTMLITYQRIHRKEYDTLEITQNARVIMDRISRELRQSDVLVTHLPQFRGTPGDPPPSEIQFQDGHDTVTIHYIRYFLNGTDLNRQIIAYEFASNPGVRVPFDALDVDGNPPTQIEVENRVVAEYVSDIDYWGLTLVRLSITIEKNNASLTTESAVHGRNL